MATQDHALVRMVFILGQAKHTVDVVDLVAQGEALERQLSDPCPILVVDDRISDPAGETCHGTLFPRSIVEVTTGLYGYTGWGWVTGALFEPVR